MGRLSVATAVGLIFGSAACGPRADVPVSTDAGSPDSSFVDAADASQPSACPDAACDPEPGTALYCAPDTLFVCACRTVPDPTPSNCQGSTGTMASPPYKAIYCCK